MRARGGVTLVELMVALAILALGASVVSLAIRAMPPARGVNPITAALVTVRDSAIRSRRSVTTILMLSDSVREITALPDGRVITDSVVRAQMSRDEAHHVAR
jgi:prepilin-type N-terminal cleavage/methylation domain-containing protein